MNQAASHLAIERSCIAEKERFLKAERKQKKRNY